MTHVDANVDAFEEAVVAFWADFEELGIKTTLKMHIVDEHITTFVKSVERVLARRIQRASYGVLPLLPREVRGTLQRAEVVPAPRSSRCPVISDCMEQ